MERTLLKWVKGRPGLGEANGWPGLRSPTEVVSTQVRFRRQAVSSTVSTLAVHEVLAFILPPSLAQMNWPRPGHTLTEHPPDTFFSVHDPLPPPLAQSVRVVLGLKPRQVQRTGASDTVAVDSRLRGFR
jgi:hypothetical protein